MKKLIRNSVYETNSSSQHSISISTDNIVYDTIYPDDMGNIILYFCNDSYGWEFVKYNSPIDKLGYALGSGVDNELLCSIVKEHTGANLVILENQDIIIDHQSYGVLNDMCLDREGLKNFIFNKNSWLFTGNDNSSIDLSFYDVGIYKDDDTFDNDYHYKIIIDGVNFEMKKKSKPNLDFISELILQYLNSYQFIIDEQKNITKIDYDWQNLNNEHYSVYFDDEIFEQNKLILIKNSYRRNRLSANDLINDLSNENIFVCNIKIEEI